MSRTGNAIFFILVTCFFAPFDQTSQEMKRNGRETKRKPRKKKKTTKKKSRETTRQPGNRAIMSADG